ncbi:hypothetical protein D9756_006774 [Leucocoprinus leucothites]|uniref:Nephrocystin 3-like N-terminal domain-containing protein n=1 Tax=Leucocoprinus leucothites TaxID=201217 RepID=A0A8H5G2B8_9AGAR|nr:hypothetical protein D9756_006774 [Leucoagaricus leucothites]
MPQHTSRSLAQPSREFLHSSPPTQFPDRDPAIKLDPPLPRPFPPAPILHPLPACIFPTSAPAPPIENSFISTSLSAPSLPTNTLLPTSMFPPPPLLHPLPACILPMLSPTTLFSTLPSRSHDSPSPPIPPLPTDPTQPRAGSSSMPRVVSPPMPRIVSSSMPHVVPTPPDSGHGIFHGAHHFILNNARFNDFSVAGSGLNELFRNSMPDAFHDSSSRDPPPRCHLGTRKDYIGKITSWAHGYSDRKEPILWMRGPFGIGKSAIAQSCAEVLDGENRLAAALFFSRSNTDRDDPRRVFTSIAYQIAAKCQSFSDIIDTIIRKDPALVTKTLAKQFEELLVRPLRRLGSARREIEGLVVIIDGLDECRGTVEQSAILNIIATSTRKRTTPFRWFITSRPEEHIIRTMNSDDVVSVSSRIKLPVSRHIDHEILIYLTDEFKKIRTNHRLPDSWPSEGVLALLVERGAGLWIYVSTIIRFVNDENSYGPEDQLRIVIKFARDVSSIVGPNKPLAEMDFFYTLIMRRIPSNIRTTVRKILLLYSIPAFDRPIRISTALCLSTEQFRRSCISIRSVMELQGGTDIRSMRLYFYHASFLEFMTDSERSKELCVYGSLLVEHRGGLLNWLHEVCSRSTDSLHLVYPSDTVVHEGIQRHDHYAQVLSLFWILCAMPKHPFDFPTAMSLTKLPFRKMLKLLVSSSGTDIDCIQLRNNLPTALREKIIRQGEFGWTRTRLWTLGYGENGIVPEQTGNNFLLVNNQDWDDGRRLYGADV